MRLLFVVQRYGEMVPGGAEQYCREMAERLSARGHEIEVATTCARSYVDWADFFAPGTEIINGVVVHRFRVAHPRDNDLFNVLNLRMTRGRGSRRLSVQREWMRMQGPHTPELVHWLERRARDFDCVAFFTYLYWTTWAGLEAVAGTVPTILHPTAHDEPPMRLSLFDAEFRLPDGFALLTPEEAELLRARFHIEPRSDVVGIGVDLTDADPSLFRTQFPMDDAPYLLFVGRLDPGKGAREIVDFFTHYKDRNPGDLRLVLLGEPLIEVPERPDIIVTGFVDYDVRDSAMAGSLALVQPSYFESFSMVLTESFAHRRPALVQGRCAVLRGHAERSGAAIPYSGFAEFEAAVDAIVREPGLADAMGRAGRAYVERDYNWDTVLTRYEHLVADIIDSVSSPGSDVAAS
jgi:glycosyltransferase involved in cell wall biosynthesis